MNFPIVYKIGEDGEGNPIFLDHEVKEIIQHVLKEVWNHRPDYDPPTWGELFTYTEINHRFLSDIVCEATMEQVICNILGMPICQTSIDEITSLEIEPNMEDIVEEYFEQLECDGDDSFYEYELNILEELEEELEEEVRAREREIIENETKPGAVLKIIEEVVQTDDQILDEGKFLELCKLLKEIHIDYVKIEKHDQVVKELVKEVEDEKEMRIDSDKRDDRRLYELRRLRKCLKYETERAQQSEVREKERVSAAKLEQFIAGQKLKAADECNKLLEIHLRAAVERAQVAEEKLRAVSWLTEEEVIAG